MGGRGSGSGMVASSASGSGDVVTTGGMSTLALVEEPTMDRFIQGVYNDVYDEYEGAYNDTAEIEVIPESSRHIKDGVYDIDLHVEIGYEYDGDWDTSDSYDMKVRYDAKNKRIINQ